MALRLKMMLGVLAPLAIVLALFAYVQYRVQHAVLLDVAQRTATDMSNAIEGSLQEAMLRQDHDGLQSSIDNISANPQVVNLLVLNMAGQVRAGAPRALVGQKFTKTDPGCMPCHLRGAALQGPPSTVLTLPDTGRVLRSWNLIDNKPACHGCHDPQAPYNGALIVDLTTAQIDRQAGTNLESTLLSLGIALFLGATLLGITMERSVLKPVGRLTQAIRDFGHGDLTRRAPADRADEIGELAAAFNQMAGGVEEKERLEQQVRLRTAELQRLYEALQEKEAMRAQLLKQVIGAQEEERKRVARELHDELAQTLTGLIMSSEAAEKMLPYEMQDLGQQLARTRDITARALAETRSLILDLRPTMLDDLGLASAIRWYAETHLSASGITVAFQAAGQQRRLVPELETSLFRIAQEAMNNIRKHARARHVWIRLSWEHPPLVSLQIRDDGLGFDPRAAHARPDEGSGMGVLGMRERAAMSGGRLEIESQPGQGTCVTVYLCTGEETNDEADSRPDC